MVLGCKAAAVSAVGLALGTLAGGAPGRDGEMGAEEEGTGDAHDVMRSGEERAEGEFGGPSRLQHEDSEADLKPTGSE